MAGWTWLVVAALAAAALCNLWGIGASVDHESLCGSYASTTLVTEPSVVWPPIAYRIPLTTAEAKAQRGVSIGAPDDHAFVAVS